MRSFRWLNSGAMTRAQVTFGVPPRALFAELASCGAQVGLVGKRSAAVSFGDLVSRDVTTRYGIISLWSRPGAYDGARPVVLAIGGVLSLAEDLQSLPATLGILADGCIMRLPGAAAPSLSPPGLATICLAVSELIEELFAGRPVVLMGVSTGAVVAMGVRAANLARVVALEPPLVTGKLWPILEPVRGALAKGSSPDARQLMFSAFGIGTEHLEERDWLSFPEGLRTPTDIVLGDELLEPERAVSRFPSLVSAEARISLAQNPRVRLHLAHHSGHNVLGQDFSKVRDVVLEACRRASAATGDASAIDEPLLEATPLTARRVLYWGDEGKAFRAAWLRSNPAAEVVVQSPRDEGGLGGAINGGFDAVVAARKPPPPVLARLAAALAPRGHLIARWAEAPADLRAQLALNGLTAREPVDNAGTGVIRAQRCEPGEAPEPALHLQTIVYAGLLMDIRTRLPARGLRSDPELQISYGAPPTFLAPMDYDAPKIVVMQRSAELSVGAWRSILANAIKLGWLVVAEYDDHPGLIAEILGGEITEGHFLRFGFAHAVQTSTPPLVEAFQSYNPEVVMFPNAAFDLAPFPEEARPPRVFYGGVLRGEFPVQVARSLGSAIEAHPGTEFVVIGDRTVFDALPTTAKRYYDYLSFEGYLRLIETCQISLSPVAAAPLVETKSDAKFIDGSRSGALTIASPTIYRRVIEHGVNGLLAPEVEDWAPLLSQALGDQAMRRRLARNAWEYVRNERMFANQVALRRDWYRDLWSRRHALTEGLMQRLPGLREAVSA